MTAWRKELTAGGKSSVEAKIQRRIYREHVPPPLLFVIAMLPFNHILWKFPAGYELCKSHEKINHLTPSNKWMKEKIKKEYLRRTRLALEMNRYNRMDDKRKDPIYPKIPSQKNRPKQQQNHNIPTYNVEKYPLHK